MIFFLRLFRFLQASFFLLVINLHFSAINCFTAGSAPTARSDCAFTGTTQGKVYIFGGGTSNSWSNELFVFDPYQNTWQQLVNTGFYAPSARIFSTLWMAPDGHLYLYGGYYPPSESK
jgi:hypothetical protein